MPILLTPQEVQELLTLITLRKCLDVQETVYRELGERDAAFRPRSDLWSPTSAADAIYRLRTMEGSSSSLGVSAIRIGSDLVQYRVKDGVTFQRHVPGATGDRYVGLILLFDVNTSELLLIFPDGGLSPIRVGLTAALAGKYMARPESKTMAILGAGNQARGHARAFSTVFSLQEIRVYSRDAAARERFAAEMTQETGVDVHPADSTAAAVRGADIVTCATNSLSPVLGATDVGDGTFVSCVEWDELEDGLYHRSDRTVVHLHDGEVRNYIGGVDQKVIDGLHKHDMGGWKAALPELGELVAGKTAGRSGPQEVTCFVNNVGSGLQFASAGKLLYEKARANGVGRELPSEWFTQELPS